MSFGNIKVVKQFMKGIYNENPPKPKYAKIWDPDQVLKLLRMWSPAEKLEFKRLTMKTVMLVLLVSGQRGQILRAMTVENMDIQTGKYIFHIENADIKQGRPGFKLEPIVLRGYPADRRLCIHTYLTKYLERTLEKRGEIKELFITTTKPYKVASRDTISRWLKSVLRLAGIDTNQFGAGSTRSASTSKAKQQGATLDQIMKAGGWTQTSTFQRFYHKALVKENSLDEFVLK